MLISLGENIKQQHITSPAKRNQRRIFIRPERHSGKVYDCCTRKTHADQFLFEKLFYFPVNSKINKILKLFNGNIIWFEYLTRYQQEHVNSTSTRLSGSGTSIALFDLNILAFFVSSAICLKVFFVGTDYHWLIAKRFYLFEVETNRWLISKLTWMNTNPAIKKTQKNSINWNLKNDFAQPTSLVTQHDESNHCGNCKFSCSTATHLEIATIVPLRHLSLEDGALFQWQTKFVDQFCGDFKANLVEAQQKIVFYFGSFHGSVSFVAEKAASSGKIKWSLMAFSGLYLCTKAIVMRKSQNILTLAHHNLEDPQFRVPNDFQTSHDDANSLIISGWLLNKCLENTKYGFVVSLFQAIKSASRITVRLIFHLSFYLKF